MAQTDDTKCLYVELKGRKTPLNFSKTFETDLGKIRAKIKKLGLSPDVMAEAIKWANTILK